jgi:hypothetical protein
MKVLVMAAVLVAGVACGQDPVKVENSNGATTIAVDVLSKPSATWKFFKNNWGKLALGAGTIIAVDRVADNNDWLWYEGNKKPKAAKEPAAPVEPPKPEPPTQSYTQTATAGGDVIQNITIYQGAVPDAE